MGVFNDKGLLSPGFSEYKLEEIEKIFVTEFSESQTRENIYSGFLIWLRYLLNICIPNEIWIDVYQIVEFLKKNRSEVYISNPETKDYSRK